MLEVEAPRLGAASPLQNFPALSLLLGRLRPCAKTRAGWHVSHWQARASLWPSRVQDPHKHALSSFVTSLRTRTRGAGARAGARVGAMAGAWAGA